MTRYTHVDSPVGTLLLTGDETGALTGLFMDGQRYGVAIDPGWREDADGFTAARSQLAEYFAGEREDFDLPLAPQGTPHQQKVWETLRAIPFGQTTTYGAIAAQTGSVPRAVGHAVGHNPIGIVIPCHRVVGANGALTGYAGGLDRKRQLLALEGAALVP